MTESVKTKKLCVSGNCSKWNLNFQKFSSIRSNALYLGVSKQTKWLAAMSTAYVLRNRQGKQAFLKENE